MAETKASNRTKRFLAFLILFGPAAILLFISTRGCNHNFKILEDYGAAVEYKFTDASGVQHSAKEFRNQVVLVNVLQSSCPENCSVSFWHLDQSVYQLIRKNKKKYGSVRIISYVTDGEGKPVEDLSPVQDMLRDQVEAYDPEIWYLASGEPQKVFDFVHNNKSLLQTGEEYFGGHAFQELMLLLDRKNHLRMVLSGKSEGMIRRMKEHIALLQKQYDKERSDAEKKN